MIEYIQNILVKGDPLDPSAFDLIVQQGQLAMGQPVPQDWRVLTGNNDSSLIVRVVYRYEVEEEL